MRVFPCNMRRCVSTILNSNRSVQVDNNMLFFCRAVLGEWCCVRFNYERAFEVTLSYQDRTSDDDDGQFARRNCPPSLPWGQIYRPVRHDEKGGGTMLGYRRPLENTARLTSDRGSRVTLGQVARRNDQFRCNISQNNLLQWTVQLDASYMLYNMLYIFYNACVV